jgi:hypothetical protein
MDVDVDVARRLHRRMRDHTRAEHHLTAARRDVEAMRLERPSA